MTRTKRGTMVASILMLVVIVTSACNQPYSQQPSVTNTPIDTSLFATPIGGTPAISMSDVANFGTQTALAQQTTTAGTPISTGVGVTTQASATSTPSIGITPQATNTATLAVSGTLPTSAPVGQRPSTYTLQRGEFPYCIARRFDVNPEELLSINGLSDGSIYYPNLSLRIPQSGSFPGTRALRSHPATYTVAASDETINSVACLFGDVDPSALAQANGLSVGAALTAGQSLSIP
ncbi:MAG: LysM peptidoglycan-binding domain-containing protein [Anaerolineae bacterium]|nr:LysM peptidoglycan-binding domain-containing protein [Anaerolineae bacterium]MCI0609025.1 LysM peptidoglycan-binding domain-containing protein [Anaerolineae bacterium]